MALSEAYQTVTTFEGRTLKIGSPILFNADGYLLPGRCDEVTTDVETFPYPYGLSLGTCSTGLIDEMAHATMFQVANAGYDDQTGGDPTLLRPNMWMFDPEFPAP